MGELDLMKPTIEAHNSGTIHFGRVAMAPGKPTTFATISATKAGQPTTDVPIFCLPGNPASAMVALQVLVLPCLQQSSGIQPVGLPNVTVTIDHDDGGHIDPHPDRPLYHRAVVTARPNGYLYATGTGDQKSSRMSSLRRANALLRLEPGVAPVPNGSPVMALLMGKIRKSY